MWRCCSQIASDYMKFYINPLRLVSAPPPPLPPHTSSAPSFSGSGAYRHPRYSYTWYTGVSQNNFLWQKYLAFNFWKISLIFFFFAAWHPSRKNALPSSSVINPRILFPFFLSLQFFHPSLINANYSCRRIFGTSLLTLFGVSLVLWRGEKGR